MLIRGWFIKRVKVESAYWHYNAAQQWWDCANANIRSLYQQLTRNSNCGADDVLLFISNENEVKLIVGGFECVSSARVNWSKSDALLVGIWEHARPSLPGGLLWR